MIDHKPITVRAPGKINLYLDILGVNKKNYHLLNTIMHTISLEDTVTLQRRTTKGEPRILVTTSWPHLPEHGENIAHTAAVMFYKTTGISPDSVAIHIEKQVPSQAGLGGGSSDAAAVLVGLNAMYNTRLSPVELCKMGVTIGADVPFCILGGCALAEGIGEILTPLPVLEQGWLVLVKPAMGIDTRTAFLRYDQLEIPPVAPPLQKIISGLEQQDILSVGAAMGNVFEKVLPELPTERLKQEIMSFGAQGATLSGSGSTVAGLFVSQEMAEDCYHTLSRRYEALKEVFLCRPVPYGASVIIEE